MATTTTLPRSVDTAPTVRWEPCAEFHDNPAVDLVGVCTGCGWPLDDHELPAAA